MNQRDPKASGEEGTATVEVALLLPLYVFVTISLIFMGSYHAMDIRLLRNVMAFSQKAGEQTNEDLSEDVAALSRGVFPNHSVGPQMQDAVLEELVDSRKMLELLNETAFNASGHYEWIDDEIVLTTEVSTTGMGHRIKKYDLFRLDDAMADELSRWLSRTHTTGEYVMVLPFAELPDEEGMTTVIDHDAGLSVRLFHEHRDVIRTQTSDGEPVRRQTRLDAGGRIGDERAMERLVEEEVSFGTSSSIWRDFWEPDEVPGVDPP